MTNRIAYAKACLLAVAEVAAMGAIGAQTQNAARPEFDVASIKPTPIDTKGFSFGPAPGGRLIVKNNPVLNLLVNAYNVRDYQILGFPHGLESERYDIEAKAEGNPAWDQVMRMLQALLEDRFKLKLHRETRELPVFVLTAAKGGIRLRPWQEGSCVTIDPMSPAPPVAPGGKPLKRCGNNVVHPKGPGMEWNGIKIDMSRLTKVLSSLMGRQVLDKTGFTSTFDLHLEWTSNDAPAGPPRPGETAPPADPAGPSIFSALREQLGLKLDSAKGPVEVLVIDHVGRPSAN